MKFCSKDRANVQAKLVSVFPSKFRSRWEVLCPQIVDVYFCTLVLKNILKIARKFKIISTSQRNDMGMLNRLKEVLRAPRRCLCFPKGKKEKTNRFILEYTNTEKEQ